MKLEDVKTIDDIWNNISVPAKIVISEVVAAVLFFVLIGVGIMAGLLSGWVFLGYIVTVLVATLANVLIFGIIVSEFD